MARKKIKPGTKHPSIKGKVRDYHGRWVTKATYDKQRSLTRTSRDLPNPTHTNRKLTRPKQGVERNYQGKRQVFKGNKWVNKKGGALVKRPSSAITKATKPGALAKRDKPGALTKQKSSAITNRRGRVVRSDTANTSRDTVRGKGTRTGQPGPNRKALKAGTQKALPSKGQTSASKSRTAARKASTARREAAKMKQTRAAKGSGPTAGRKPIQGKPVSQLNRAKRWVSKNAPKAAKVVKKGGSKLSKLAARTGVAGKIAGRALIVKEGIDTAKRVFNPKDNIALSVANLAQAVRGKRSLGQSKLAKARNKRLDAKAREAYNKDPNKAPGAIKDFDKLTPAQLTEVRSKSKPKKPKNKNGVKPKNTNVVKSPPKKDLSKVKDKWGKPAYYKGTDVKRSNVFTKGKDGKDLGVMTRNQRKAYDTAAHKEALRIKRRKKKVTN